MRRVNYIDIIAILFNIIGIAGSIYLLYKMPTFDWNGAFEQLLGDVIEFLGGIL